MCGLCIFAGDKTAIKLAARTTLPQTRTRERYVSIMCTNATHNSTENHNTSPAKYYMIIINRSATHNSTESDR